MVRCFVLIYPGSWPAVISSSVVCSEGKWEWKEHGRASVINLMSALSCSL